MGRRKQDADWEGIIRGVGALAMLGVVYTAMTGGNVSAVADALWSAVGWVVTWGIVLLAVVLLCLLAERLLNKRRAEDERVVARHASTSTFHPDDRPETPSIEECLEKLDWFQFEKLIAALFEGSGYAVERRGGGKADGGIDLITEVDGSRCAVQCKHWKSWKCGVSVVRELVGAMTHEQIPQGYLIASGFTEEAKALAAEHGIALVNRVRLVEWIGEALAAAQEGVSTALENPAKLCPKCGAKMVKRTAKRGANVGSQFWGCSRYPKCNQILK